MKQLFSFLLALRLVSLPLIPVFAADHALTHSKNAQDEVNILDLTVGVCTVGQVLECAGVSGQVGLGLDDTIATVINDANNNSVVSILTLEHTTTGTPASGIGARLTYKIEDAGGTEDQGYLDMLLTDVTENSEDAHLNILIQQAGNIEEIISVEGDNKRILLGDSDTALTNAVSDRLTLLHRTTGDVAAGFGLGLTFEIEDAGGPEEQGSIDVELDVVTSGSEEATMTFDVNLAGTMTEVMRLDGTAGFASFGGVATAPAEAIEVENANATTAIQISNSATDGDPYLAWALSGTKAFSMGVDDGDSDKLKIGTTAIGTATMLEFDSSGNLRVLVGIDAIGAVDLDIGSADVTDVTVVTDGGTIVLDGSITQDAGTTLAMGGTLDATGAVDMDYGSGDITDHTFTTDGGTVVIDGNITQDAGTTLAMGGTLDATGAVDMDYGSGDITDHTFTTDGTGTAEVVFPAGSIDTTELLDGTILNADVNSSAAIALSKTALSAGTNITLSTNTLNVDDAFLVNDASDTTTGTLTADGYVGNLYDASGSVDLDIGSADVTDVTVITDGGTVVIDGSITQDAGTTLAMGGTLDATGAVDMDYGSADITDHTFTTDGTGTAEVVLPAGSIDSTELLDGTIVNADVNSSAAIAVSKTALTAGTNITLSTNELSVDDAFLKNDASDTTTGTLTAAGYVGGLYDAYGAADLDIGSGDITDVTIVTDGGTVVIDGSITQDAGTTLAMGGTLDATGAVDMDYGSADITDHTFVTDGTGTAEVVLPAGSIDTTELLDATILNADVSASAAIVMSKTALVGGTNITLSTNTLNVDDAFLINNGNDQTSGNLTIDGDMYASAGSTVGSLGAAGDGTFHIHTATAGSVTAGTQADELVLESSSDTGMSILTPYASKGSIFFGNPLHDHEGDAEEAYIDWDGSNSRLGFATAKTGAEIRFRTGTEDTALTLDATGLATFAQDLLLTDTTAPGNTAMCVDSAGASLIGRCTSLGKFKDNIQPLSLGYEEILALTPSTFTWDAQHGGDHDLGFIAENVESVSPLLVTYDEDGKLQGVKYRRLTAVLAKAIQEQQRMIMALNDRIFSLETQ